METPIIPDRKARRILLWIYGIALAYYVTKLIYFALVIGGFPDEQVHISYIADMVRNPRLIPDFRNMHPWHVIAEDGFRVVMTPNPKAVNYLGHPPLYYLLMTLTGGVRMLPDGTAEADLLRLRAVNILLSSATVILACRLGFTRLRNRSPLAHGVYAAAVVTLPLFGYVGAGVNNDNLAYLAMAVFFTGLLRYQEDRTDLKTYLMIGIGFMTGGLAKLTTALIMGIMLAVILLMSVFRTRSLKLILNRNFALTLPCYLVFLAYEICIRKDYGIWQPTLSTLAYDYFVKTVFYVPEAERLPWGLPQYAAHFLLGFGYSWSSLYGHQESVNAVMHNGVFGLVYWVPVGTAVFLGIRQLIRREFDRLTLPALCGFFGTLLYHFYNGWSNFRRYGYTGGNQARYYLGMMMIFAFLMCRDLPPLFSAEPRSRRILRGLAVLLILSWLAGDYFRLLMTFGFTHPA